MKRINRQYEIIKELHHISAGVKYFEAFDIKSLKQVNLLFIEQKNVNRQLLLNIDSIYDKMKRVDIPNVAKVLAYDFVHSINGEHYFDSAYIVVFEHIYDRRLIDHTFMNDGSNVLKLLIQMIQILNYLLLKEVHWNYFHYDDVFVKEKDGEFSIFLRNPISAAVLNDFERFSKNRGLDLQNRDLIADFSFKDFGRLFLSLLFEFDKEEDFGTAFSLFREKVKSLEEMDTLDVDIIIHIFEKILTEGYIQRAFLFSSIIDDINTVFGTRFKQILVDETQNISLSSNAMLVEKIYENIHFHYHQVIDRNPNKQFLFVDVKSGEHTDRLLLDIYRKLSLSGAKMHEFFQTEGDDYTFEWIELFRSFRYDFKLVREFGGKQAFLSQYEALLYTRDSITEEDLLDKHLMRLLTVAAEVFIHNVNFDPGIMMFYHFDALNSFILYTVYLAYRFSRQHRCLTVAFCDMQKEENDVIRKVKSFLTDAGHLKKLSSEFFDYEETKEFLYRNFYHKRLPVEFIEYLYLQTDGNIKSIYQFLEYAVKNRIIEFDCDRRLIELHSNYEQFECYKPGQIEKKYNVSYFESFSKEQKEVLRWMSMFVSSQGKDFIAKISGISFDSVSDAIHNLVKKEVLNSSIRNNEIVYEFEDELFKNFIYQEILDSQTKMTFHRRAVNFLSGKTQENLLILAKHYLSLGDEKSIKRASNIWLYLGNHYHKRMDYDNSEHYYTNALGGTLSVRNRFSVNLMLLKQYNIQTKVEKILKVIDELEELSKELDDGELLAEFYGRSVMTLTYNKIDDRAAYYSDALIRLKEETGLKLAAAYYFANEGRRMVLLKDAATAIEYLEKAFDLCEEKYRDYDLKSFILRTLAFSHFFMSDYDKALLIFEKAIEYARLGNDARGEMIVNNNMLAVYNSVEVSDENDARIIQLLKKNYKLSREQDIYSVELYALSNLSKISARMGKMEESFEYAKTSLMRMEETGSQENIMAIMSDLMRHYSRQCNYTKSYSCYEKIAENPDADNKKLQYWMNVKEPLYLMFHLRNFEKVYETSVEVLKNVDTDDKHFILPESFFLLFCKIYLFQTPFESLVEDFNQVTSEDYAWSRIMKNEYIYFLHEAAIILYNADMTLPFEKLSKSAYRFCCSNLLTDAMLQLYDLILNEHDEKMKVDHILQYLDREKENNLSIQMCIHLSRFFMKQGQIWEATSFIFKAIRLILVFLKKTPTEFHKQVFEVNYFIRPFTYLEHFSQFGNYDDLEFSPERTISFERLDYYLYRMNLHELGKTLNVAENLQKEQVLKDPQYLSLESLVVKFTNDFEANVRHMIEYMAQMLLATEAYLCVPVNNVLEPILFVKNGKTKYFRDLSDKFDFHKQHVVWNLESHTSPIHAVLSIPIFLEENTAENGAGKPSAVIVFATKKIINNFDDEKYQQILKCKSMFSIFIEDYLLRKMDSEDRLTKVLSRKYLDLELIQKFVDAREKSGDLSILIIDLDDFKMVNDMFGHLTGDSILREMAKITLQEIESPMSMGRYGGEEFVVILPDKDAKKAHAFAEIIRKKVEKHDFEGIGNLNITISIGVASIQKEQDSLSALIERADQALYRAKQSGKNKSVIWRPDIEVKKSDSGLAKEIVIENQNNNPRYRLAFVEMLSELSEIKDSKEGLFKVLSKMLDVLSAKEVVVVKNCQEESRILSLKRKDADIEYLEVADEELLEEIRKNKNGFYRNDWNSKANVNEITGLIEWNCVMGFELMSQGECTAYVYLRSNYREREFNKQDLSMANVFSNFLIDYL